ncbi:MAG: YceI family protein [Bacteriovoracales bacterium]
MKKLFLLISLLVFLPFSTFAKTCTFTTNPKNIKVTWTAYKTPQKVAVNGTFEDIKFEGPMSGKSIDEIVKSSTFLIKTDSVDSKDKARDMKIAQFFFKKMTGEAAISGKVTSMDKETINLEITMNGKSVTVPMSYKIKKSKLSAKGELDVLNFGMEESLKSITQACSEKHEKKTWSEVGLALQASFKKSCK